MNLIDEIRAHLQSSASLAAPIAPHVRERKASVLLERALAALEAAQELRICVDVYHKLAGGSTTKAAIALRRFDAAMEGRNE
jgi:hypothetical protein